MADFCTKEIVFSIPTTLQRCAYVKEACGDKAEFMNYLEFYYCGFNENLLVTILLSVSFEFYHISLKDYIRI